jgi:hypothetical protein
LRSRFKQDFKVTDDTAKLSPSVQPLDEAPAGRDEELGRLGITTQQHTIYEWNGYRYSNAADAIAAAKRASR